MANKDRPIIIKKIKKVQAHGHHGGAWKIAYADFVTAMMAFFLLMWLLAVADKETKRGLSDYFNNPPVRLSLMGGEGVGEQTRPLPGGGTELQKSEGEAKRGTPEQIKAISEQEAKEFAKKKELAELEELKDQIAAAIDSIPSLKPYKGQLLLDLTSEGLRIQIVDQESRPMFDQGKARLKPYAAEILEEISALINETGKRISISGHTDSTPFVGGEGGYSNWELSNDRANAARRELVAGGLQPERVMRVVGLASTVLLDKENPGNPQNRRIAIVVMNKDTEESIEQGEGDQAEADQTEADQTEADQPAADPGSAEEASGEAAPSSDADPAG